jgi:hypothetical protein
MQVIINGETREVKVENISTLLDVICQIETTLPQGQIISEIQLNNKVLSADWYQNSSKIYLLDEDTLVLTTSDSSKIALQTLINSKTDFDVIINHFADIADSFRLHDDVEANARFIQGIENLQWYLQLIEDATFLLGRPLDKIIHEERKFIDNITDLSIKLETIISYQINKDWIMLADMIEYEMLPTLKKIGSIYEIFGV